MEGVRWEYTVCQEVMDQFVGRLCGNRGYVIDSEGWACRNIRGL